MNSYVPVILFVYRRLDHLQQTISALQNNFLAKETLLIIYSDAASKPEHKEEVDDVREYLRAIAGFLEVKIVLHKENVGLAKSIVNGVTEQVNVFGKIIVMEDDLITSPYFLTYMNDALSLYEKDERVMHVSGYTFPTNKNLPDTFFVRLTTSWGWGTWKRAWDHLSLDTDQHILEITKRNKIAEFELDDSMGYFAHLQRNQKGVIETWAVKWYASVFLLDGLTLFPKRSLVRNIGHDGSGENCTIVENFELQELAQKIIVKKVRMRESSQARKAFMYSLLEITNTPTKWRLFKNKIRDKIRYEFRNIFGRK